MVAATACLNRPSPGSSVTSYESLRDTAMRELVKPDMRCPLENLARENPGAKLPGVNADTAPASNSEIQMESEIEIIIIKNNDNINNDCC